MSLSPTTLQSQPPRDKLQRPLASLRISVTDRCNFRCPYCMPKEVFGDKHQFLSSAELLSNEELVRLVRIFARLGVRKFRLTGGEPLIRPHLPELIAGIRQVPGIGGLSLTTNGYLLEQMAERLKAAGLARVTVSLDSMDPAVAGRLNGLGLPVDPVLRGIAKANQLGLAPVKLNAVVIRGTNDAGVVDLARYFKGTGVIVRFIEYMDVGSKNGWTSASLVPAAEIIERIGRELPLEPAGRTSSDDTAESWRYVDGSGEIGVIASVSRPFCRSCTRARLSADGRLVTCLFATGGTDLKGPLRAGASDDELEQIVRAAWGARSDRYSELRATLGSEGQGRKKLEMYQLGG